LLSFYSPSFLASNSLDIRSSWGRGTMEDKNYAIYVVYGHLATSPM
jgi:hypothetical protein